MPPDLYPFSFSALVPSPLCSPSDHVPSPSATATTVATSTSAVFSELESIKSRAQLTSLRCQQLCQNFDERLEILKSELETQSDRFMNELEDVELWIQNAYVILRQEPVREIEGVYSQQEMDAEEEEVMSQRSQDVMSQRSQEVADGVGSVDGGGLQVGRIAGTPDLFSSGEFFASDGSLGSEGFIGSLEERKIHDTSVDPDLSDEEYSRQILERVISPEPEGDGQGDTSVDNLEYNVAFSMSAHEVSKVHVGPGEIES